MSNYIAPETQEWLLTAWKKMTLPQMVDKTGINYDTLNGFFCRNDIEPMKIRDLVTSEIFRMRDNGDHMVVKLIAQKMDCSEPLVKSILFDYDIPEHKNKKQNKAVKSYRDHDVVNKEHGKREEEKKIKRAAISVYTQSSSQLIDEVRGIKTINRSEKLLSNG